MTSIEEPGPSHSSSRGARCKIHSKGERSLVLNFNRNAQVMYENQGTCEVARWYCSFRCGGATVDMIAGVYEPGATA